MNTKLFIFVTISLSVGSTVMHAVNPTQEAKNDQTIIQQTTQEARKEVTAAQPATPPVTMHGVTEHAAVPTAITPPAEEVRDVSLAQIRDELKKVTEQVNALIEKESPSSEEEKTMAEVSDKDIIDPDIRAMATEDETPTEVEDSDIEDIDEDKD